MRSFKNLNRTKTTSFDIIRDDLNELWKETTGDPRICIAVLDGQVDFKHDCLKDAQLEQLEPLIPGSTSCGASLLHGTHVTSIIFGQHGSLIHGVAPRCRGLIIPIFSDGPGGTINNCSQLHLARAITQAVQEGAHIINISGGQLATEGEVEDELARAVQLCAENNVLIVSAGGNDGCECVHVPASLYSVLAVGAMNTEGIPLKFSNWGKAYQRQGILAPGENILGAIPSGDISYKSGTSYATPIVTGIIALFLSLQLKNEITPDPFEIKKLILGSAFPCPAEHLECSRFLRGRINIIGVKKLLHEKVKRKENINISNSELISLTRNGTLPSVLMSSFNDLKEINLKMKGIKKMNNNEINEETNGQMDWSMSPKDQEHVSTSITANQTISQGHENTVGKLANSIAPSTCGCGCGGTKGSSNIESPFVYAIGQLAIDFSSDTRRDFFVQMGADPNDPVKFIEYLKKYPEHIESVTWILVQESAPIYAIVPIGAYASKVYEVLLHYYEEQIKKGVERVSIPGTLVGNVSLIGSQDILAVNPDLRGMHNWSTEDLVRSVIEATGAPSQEVAEAVANFLNRIYNELLNPGLNARDRAINYVATNALQVTKIFMSAIKSNMVLDKIEAVPAPGRQDTWDIRLIFFNPLHRFEQARRVYKVMLCINDQVPVQIGQIQTWEIY